MALSAIQTFSGVCGGVSAAEVVSGFNEDCLFICLCKNTSTLVDRNTLDFSTQK